MPAPIKPMRRGVPRDSRSLSSRCRFISMAGWCSQRFPSSAARSGRTPRRRAPCPTRGARAPRSLRGPASDRALRRRARALRAFERAVHFALRDHLPVQLPHPQPAALAEPERILDGNQQAARTMASSRMVAIGPVQRQSCRSARGRDSSPISPRSSSMRSSWLYFARRSERDSEPVLICIALVATAMSAIVVSSVSPERCEIDGRVAARASPSRSRRASR